MKAGALVVLDVDPGHFRDLYPCSLHRAGDGVADPIGRLGDRAVGVVLACTPRFDGTFIVSAAGVGWLDSRPRRVMRAKK